MRQLSKFIHINYFKKISYETFHGKFEVLAGQCFMVH